MQVLERLPGNPIGIAYWRVDEARTGMRLQFLRAKWTGV
jgi:hypothetical protein